MRTAAILIAWAGYAVGSWGYVIYRRWNIGFVPWVSPLHPWQWPPAGDPVPPIPADRVFPGHDSSGTQSARGTAQPPAPAGTKAHRCPEGQVWVPSEGQCVPLAPGHR